MNFGAVFLGKVINKHWYLAIHCAAYIAGILLLLGASGSSRADEPILLDEFSDVFCTDELRGRVDNFFSEISKRPGLIGVVIWRRDVDIPGRASRYVEIIRNHARFRHFSLDRLRFVESVVGDSTNFKFYIVLPTAALQKYDEPNRPLTVRSTTLFDSSRIAQIERGVVQFGELVEEPCDLGLNLGQYSAVFRDDANLTVYLVASARNAGAKKKVLTALRLTSEELIRSYRIPRARIRLVYTGVRRESAMQLWIVPKAGKVPSYRRGTLP